MPESYYRVPHQSPAEIARLEAQIAQVPLHLRSVYELAQRGITIPPGYRLENGRLKYVAVDNNPRAPWYLRPEIMIPAVIGGPLAYGAATGAFAGGAGLPTLPSTTYGTGMGTAPSLSGASTIGGVVPGAAAGSALPIIPSRVIGNGMGTDPTDISSAIPPELRQRTRFGGGDNGGDDGGGVNLPGWQDLLKLLGPIVGGTIAGRAGPGSNATAEMPPELKELLGLQMNRIKQSQPNYELMLRMAEGLQPNWARNGPTSSGRTAEPRY